MPDKYEREIEEILRKASFPAPRGQRRSSSWTNELASAWQRYTVGLSPSRLLVLGLGLALVGYFTRWFIPELGFPISLLALVLLVGGLALSISRRHERRETTWRGRRLDLSSSDLWATLRRRWDEWRRRRRW